MAEKKKKAFDPEGDGYDMDSAIAAGMQPDGTGEDEGHWGSVRQVSQEEAIKLGLPEDAYMILKGKKHPTFHKAVEAEKKRGFVVKKIGDRYFSVPVPWLLYDTMR